MPPSSSQRQVRACVLDLVFEHPPPSDQEVTLFPQDLKRFSVKDKKAPTAKAAADAAQALTTIKTQVGVLRGCRDAAECLARLARAGSSLSLTRDNDPCSDWGLDPSSSHG